MSTVDRIAKITDRAGTGAPNFTNGFTIAGVDSGITVFTHTEGSTAPSNPSNGDTWWDTGNDAYYVRMNNAWQQWLGVSFSGPAYMGTRGIIAGGYGPSSDGYSADDIQYITIASPGNATDFGDLSRKTSYTGMHSNGSRIVICGGRASSGIYTDAIDYVTAASPGNSSDFGDLTNSRMLMGCGGDATRTVCGGGWGTPAGAPNNRTEQNIIDYITTGTTGNATDFGDLSYYRDYISATSDATRTIFAGGEDYSSGSNASVNIMEYVTTQTTGNVTDFGDLLAVSYDMGGGVIASETRGIFVGGGQFTLNPYTFTYLQTIQYVTIATTGNATDFGDTLQGLVHAATCADGTTGIIAGGQKGGSGSQDDNTIQKITIATTGNATDFGDLNPVGGQDSYNKNASAASGS